MHAGSDIEQVSANDSFDFSEGTVWGVEDMQRFYSKCLRVITNLSSSKLDAQLQLRSRVTTSHWKRGDFDIDQLQ